jgi:hypothetical protein
MFGDDRPKVGVCALVPVASRLSRVSIDCGHWLLPGQLLMPAMFSVRKALSKKPAIRLLYDIDFIGNLLRNAGTPITFAIS